MFKSGPNIKTLLTSRNKTKLPKNSYPGVYKIPCSCGITPYIGETKKKICTRIKEHQEYIRKEDWERSGIALHSRDCNGHIEFEQASTLKVEFNNFDRKVRETLEIQRHDAHFTKGGVNQDKGKYVNTNFWLPFFKHLNTKERGRRRTKES